MKYSKVLNDPIHGHIELDDACIQFIDTPQFQRLRDLKQLGANYYVFTGASHNRFEHSIGVCHLAGELIHRFARDQPSLDISQETIKYVQLAGLCHDLGHGPFSHMFDNEFIPQARPDIHWSHEDASEMMLEYLVNENGVDDVDTSGLAFMKDLIKGRPRGKGVPKEGYLYDIVANQRNSVDVDKFDYIGRDCYNLGIKAAYDTSRLMTFSRVIDDQVCFNQKEAYNLYEMFHARYSLFKRIYTHRVGKAVEYMLTDALHAADPYLNISATIDDPEQYMNLTDSIVKEIERSTSEELAPSRAILHRLRRRQLYNFVDEFLVPAAVLPHLTKAQVCAERIVSCAESNSSLKADDLIVEWLRLTYAMKDKNPVDSIRFFNKFKPDESFHIDRTHVSLLIPSQYEEVIIRIYARQRCHSNAIQTAFRNWLAELDQQLQGLGVLDSYQDAHDDRVQSILASSQSIQLDEYTAPNAAVELNNNHTLLSPFRTPHISPSRNGIPVRFGTPSGSPNKLIPNVALTLPDNFEIISQSPRKRPRGL